MNSFYVYTLSGRSLKDRNVICSNFHVIPNKSNPLSPNNVCVKTRFVRSFKYLDFKLIRCSDGKVGMSTFIYDLTLPWTCNKCKCMFSLRFSFHFVLIKVSYEALIQSVKSYDAVSNYFLSKNARLFPDFLIFFLGNIY